MDDLINRKAAIDMFQNLAYDDWNQGVSTTWANAYSECAEMIRDMPSAPERRGKWIPVSERLPEIDKEVLVYLWGDCPCLAWVNESGQWETEHFFLDKDDAPNAWMPLPDPYKEGEDG